jgi:hypothetical protein
MTITEMLTWFDVLQDKYGSPYFTDSEKLLFLNRAQWEYVNATIPSNEGGIVNMEVDENVLKNVSSLLFELTVLNQSTSGIITNATINSTLQTVSGDGTAEFIKVMRVKVVKNGRTYPAKFARHNDIDAFHNNYFKKPTYDTPKYTLQNNGFQFNPTDTVASIYFTVLKRPKDMTLVVNCELPQITHNEIVALGLQFAGIASRDEILQQMNNLQLTK